MPFDFVSFPYPVQKNMVDQMTKTDLVRVSLQSREADNILRECGKMNVSFFDLNDDNLMELSAFDKLEFYLLETKRSGEHSMSRFDAHVHINDRLSMFINAIFNGSSTKFSIHFECIDRIDQFHEELRYLMIGENCVPITVNERGEVTTFWNNKANGMIALMESIYVNPKSSITHLHVNGCNHMHYSKNLRKLVDYFVSHKIKIVRIEIGSENKVSDKDFEYIMENVTADFSFEIKEAMRVNEGFKFDGKIKARSVAVIGSWFTLQHLLNTDYNHISVKSRAFTNEDMRTFLKLWVAGEFPRLSRCWFGEIENLNIPDILAGFIFRKDHRDEGKSIKGKNGAYAKFHKLKRGYFGFIVYKSLEEDEIEAGEDQEARRDEDEEDEDAESENDRDEEDEQEESENEEDEEEVEDD
ncbi:unnamed protein product [Caenorhabditis brenneri]